MFKALIVSVAAISGAMGYMSDVDLIKDGEGYRQCTYKDTMGIKTVCYGFNLERGSAAKNAVARAGGDYNSLINGGCANQNICNKLLDFEVQSARGIAQRQFGSVSCPAAKAVTVDLAYNLGAGGIAGFRRFTANIKSGNWNGAAAELQDSAYCRQVGRRCTRNMNQIKTCKSHLMLVLIQ